MTTRTPSDHAILRLSAYTWERNDYQLITNDISWHIKATEVFSGQSHYHHEANSKETRPEFKLSPGVYTLHVQCDKGEKNIENVVLHPGAIVDEVVYFGHVGIDDREENYDLSDDASFDSSSEYLRRLNEREGQRAFGANADSLRNPDIIPPAEPGHEFDQSMEAQSNFKAHPVLATAKQFDGVGLDMARDTSRNQHAAEAQLQPDLAPGAQPTASPSSPTPSPFH